MNNDEMTGLELERIVADMVQRFPTIRLEDIREVVESTYREMAATARIKEHLLALTSNYARRRLLTREAAAPATEAGQVPLDVHRRTHRSWANL